MSHHSNTTRALGALVFFLAGNAIAQVTVADAWVRGTVGNQTTTAAYMRITAATDATLVGITSPAAKVTELHDMKLEGGIMKMSPVAELPLAAGKAVDLKPGGYHVMLVNLAHPLKEGDAVPLTLMVKDKAGKTQPVAVQAVVRPLTALVR